MKKLLSSLILTLGVMYADAQLTQPIMPKQHNLSTITTEKQVVTQELEERTPKALQSHPEFGVNPYNAPCTDCIELLGERTEYERVFVTNGTNGTEKYMQKGYSPMHYRDAQGNWRTIDTRLKATNIPHLYTAPHQYAPVKIDAGLGFTTIAGPTGEVKLNRELELLYTDGVTTTSLGKANWSNYTVGDDGVKVVDAWPGIDIVLKVSRGGVESDFVVKHALPNTTGRYLVRDFMQLPANHRLEGITPGQLSYNDFTVVSANGEEQFRMMHAFAYDMDEAAGTYDLAYNYSQTGGYIDIEIPASWLNTGRQYPVTIDPFFNQTGTLPVASITGSGYDPVCFQNGCSYNLSVNTYPNSTVTDIFFQFEYNAIGGCLRNQGAVQLTSGACMWPSTGIPQSCNLASGGLCNFNNVSVFSPGLQGCVPPPQCAAYALPFTLNFFRCTSAGGCSNTCIAASQNWVMTVKCNTVEIATISGAQTICQGNSVNISATAQYGVPGYTYNWTPGNLAGSSVSVSPASTQLYTVTATDACGQTATGTVNVNVNQVTNPGFSIGTATICAGQSFNIFGGGGGTVNGYDWTLPGSSQPTVNNSQNVNNVSYATAGTYTITLNYNNPANGCFAPLAQTITVNPNVTPTITITANPSGPVCAGECVDFTATITNGGTGSMTLRKNGSGAVTIPVSGPGPFVFTYCNYVNGDNMRVDLTTNAPCASPTTVQSNVITMQVVPIIAPTVTITQSPANPVCPGTPVTYTATYTGGGAAPTFVWQAPNPLPSTTSNTFTSSALPNGTQVAVTMNSSASTACVFPSTAFSNVLTLQVAGTTTPSVSITANPAGPICPGQSVTFTATPTNGGATPTYQWYNGATPVGTGPTYTTTGLTAGNDVYVVMTSNVACPTTNPVTSNHLTIGITTPPVPSVTIAANPPFPVCAGTNVTFTATPTNGGAAPSYQWKLNGGNVGTNSATYSNAGLTTGNTIEVVMTSNAPCASPTTATSTQIVANITSSVTPTINITANPGNTICAGTNVTFTANITNGGAAPTYVWRKNGTIVGGNTATYSDAGLTNGNTITCTLTSNDPCASPTTATSNTITMTVNPNVVPSVSIAANPGNTICAGQSVTFTATPTNGGAAPTYQWKKNNVNVGTNSTTYTDPGLIQGDVITVVMTSNDPCASPVTATATNITMTVNAVLVPAVTIAASPAGPVCSGTNVTFTATPTNGGAAPTYQWKLNNGNVGTNSATYSNNTLANGDVITVVMTSNATCANPTTATATDITMVITTTVTPSVTITANPGNTICQGAAVTFTANVTSGGTAPTYQWYSGGTPIGGAINSTYLTNSLTNGEQISVRIVSNDPCASTPNATSNVITMTVNPNVVPSVTVSSNPGSPVCAGTAVTFTATAVNGGTPATYQWAVNNNPLPPPYNTQSVAIPPALLPAGTANVTVTITSTAACASPATVTSPQYSFTVNPLVPPAATISVSPNTPVCTGSALTFTAVAGTAGSAPTYQWMLNNAPVAGATSSTWSPTNLNNNDAVTVVVTSNDPCASPTSVTSNVINAQIISQLIPSVGISAVPASPICAGTNVTFTATPTNGGAAPMYQWYIGANPQGAPTASNTFSTAALVNGDIVTVVLTSSEPCAVPTTATSNQVTMTVNPVQTPSVTIAGNPASPICAGTSVTFTATPTNGGAAPAYVWLNNGTPIVPAQTGATYTTTGLTSTDVISVQMTSNIACPSPAQVTSNTVSYTVNPVPVPSVTIASNPNTAVCPGTPITFTATATNGGANPTFEWLVNTASQGAPSGTNTFTISTLNNNDQVAVRLTSDALCASPTTATSTAITVTVLTVTTPAVSVVVNSATTICQGQSVTFTATPTNGGPAPSYAWTINSNPAGTNSPTFTTTALNNGDIVEVTMTSNQPCANPTTAVSTPITMTVNPILVPSVTITDNPTGTVCQGTPITFTATPTNPGATPTYQWFINNVAVPGATSPVYTNNTPVNGGIVTVQLTSSEQCAQPTSATSTGITMSVISTVVPTVTITPDVTFPVCENTAVNFTADTTGGGPAPTFVWEVNNTPQAFTGQVFNYTPNNGDVIEVTFTSNAQCANPTTAQATVNVTTLPYLTPTISIVSNPATSVCLGQTVTFTATVTDAGTNAPIQWYVNGSPVGTNSTTFTSNSINPGDIIEAEVTSTYQCSNSPTAMSNQITLTFNPPITVTLDPTTATTCSYQSTLITATATGGDGGPYVYTWDDGTTGNTIIVSPDVTTPYTVSVTDGCGTTPGTATANITVLPTPQASFNFSPNDKITTLDDVFFNNNSQDADWWQWDFGDLTPTIDLDPNPVHQFEDPGTYNVTLYATNASGCSDTMTVTIEVKEQSIYYVPNAFTPNTDGKNELFRVYTTNVDNPYTLIIYARNGEEVYNSEEDAPFPGAIYWTGQKHNKGVLLPEGVYVYYLYVHNPYLKKGMWTKRGTISMFTGQPPQ